MKTNNIITATDAIRSFSDIINKVHYQHQSFDIKKGKSIVARIIPYHQPAKITTVDLNDFFKSAPKLSSEDGSSFVNEINELRNNAKTRNFTWE
jgi:uncharacterized protein YkwD